MPPTKLIEELKRIGDQFGTLTSKHKKKSKASQHAQYKQKRITEAMQVWDEFTKAAKELEEVIEQDEQYDLLKQGYVAAYKDYMEMLVAIQVEPQDNSENGEEREEDDRDNVDVQLVRFESLKRNLAEVERRIGEDGLAAITAIYVQVKSKKINEIWNRIELDNETLRRSEKTEDYKQSYLTMESRVEETLILLQGKMKQDPSKHEGLKLSRVIIPKFNGDYFKWITFRDLFKSMVLDNETLSASQQMQILKTNITGEAEKILADLTVSEVNMQCAWDRLAHRYENKKVIVYRLLTKLTSQPMQKGDANSMKTMLDLTDQTLLALKNLDRPIEHWNDWIVLYVTQKFTTDMQREWEKYNSESNELPDWERLKKFMEEQYRLLERIESNNRKTDQKGFQRAPVKTYQTSFTKAECMACDKDHSLFSCQKFKGMEIDDRWMLAKKKRLCFSCLKQHTDKPKCDIRKPCKRCDKMHSTWLHPTTRRNNESPEAAVVLHATLLSKDILLATAVVAVTTGEGTKILLRALIDSGSQGSLVTRRAAERLVLPMTDTKRNITGLGGSITCSTKRMTIELSPRFESDWKLEINCYVLKALTKMMPDHNYNPNEFKHLAGLTWADPQFYRRGSIDLLIGMDVLVEIMKAGFIKGPQGQPMAQETKLGWIMSGHVDRQGHSPELKCLINTSNNEDNKDNINLEKFWEIEELQPERNITSEELECEEFYQKTVKRDMDGNYIVKIPFRKDTGPERLGNSRGQCMARFLQLERKFASNKELKDEYSKVIEEYLRLGHMKDVTDLADEEKKYYIPHHAVFKPDSLTTKLRVVFDASAKTSTGISFNDCMYTGKQQQQDLMSILIRWRKHKVVFKADIEKMYRQINLDAADQQYHTILWRTEPKTKIREYQLTTATFGTAAAPFMATRTLIQIAKDNAKKFPLAEPTIKEDFYVDDLISGSETVEQAISAKNELMATLKAGGMELRKWASNSKELLSSIPEDKTEKSLQSFEIGDSKTLGLQWNPTSDTFGFEVKWSSSERVSTKRKLLSEASRLYDPLGWIAPIMVKAKMIMKQAYITELGWDDKLPDSIIDEWQLFKQELPAIENLKIPRWIKAGSNNKLITLCGFCDASEKAYGAVVYTRVEYEEEVQVTMIAAKTRVAPKKAKLTLPQLELCGAVLLSNLMRKVKDAFQISNVKMFAWTDSMITLGWIKAVPDRWKTFVANRVAEIQNNKIDVWGHVISEENPADCSSRGVTPAEISMEHIWFTGPRWLKDAPDTWGRTEVPELHVEERNLMVNVATIEQDQLWNRSSDWDKLVRLVAYCRRIKYRQEGKLTLSELEKAKTNFFKLCQENVFADEMVCLQQQLPISKKSKLISLDPFLDTEGLLRVGGRLEHAQLSFDEKHPIILPNGHTVTKLLHRQMHRITLHGGPQLINNMLRKRYWTIQGKQMARDAYSQCVTCRRFAGRMNQQKMGNLPAARITPGRAFSQTGLDYAGPVSIKSSNLRSSKIESGYIALFVCMATKAIHLELVSNLTTTRFLAAFERFTSRRGLPTVVWSDNGTNFVGAANKMERDLLKTKNEEIAEKMVVKGITWEFIPPSAPHFGGLWERGVRSVKEHLKKTLGTSSLTFEEYGTLLCKIEACLNSRPLCAMNDDIESIDVLTPGHFLIGNALLSPPEPRQLDYMITRSKRWEYVQTLNKQIWEKWSNEYLRTLQQRQKWKQETPNVMVGDIVAVKEDNMPPQKWLLGRIMETHAGTDGKIRVATLKITSGNPPKAKLTTRPIVKLCPLLSEMDEIQKGSLNIRDQENEEALKKHDGERKKKERRYFLRPRARLNPITVVIALIGLLLLCGASDNPMKITPFKNNAGIYFENLGRANLARSHWNLVTYFNLDKYHQELRYIQEAFNKLEGLCNKVELKTDELHCKDLNSMIRDRLINMKTMNELLQENKLHNVRTKRGAFDGVGWLGHKLFGIMDAEHAKVLEADMAKCKKDANHVLELLKKQSSTVELTANIMKSMQDEGAENHRKIITAVERIINMSELNRQHNQILSWALYISSWIDRTESVQREIIQMLTDLQQGHVSSYLFTPRQFKEQLTIIHDHVPAGTKLPADPQNDIRSFYEMMRGEIRVMEKTIIIEIRIPLISTFEFQLFHLIPIPTKRNDHRISIQVENEYLFITLQRDVFYQLNKEELRSCMNPPSGSIICKITKPWSTALSTKGRCERDILARQPKLNLECKITISPDEDFWAALTNENKWIYDLKQEVMLNIVCDNDVSNLKLSESGILELEPGCEASYNGNTFLATSSVTTTGNIDFQPKMKLNELIDEGSMGLHLNTTDHTDQFNYIHSELSSIRAETLDEQKANKIQNLIGIIFITAMCTSIIGIWIWKSITKYCNTKKNGDTSNNTGNRKKNKTDDSTDKPVFSDIIKKEPTMSRAELKAIKCESI